MAPCPTSGLVLQGGADEIVNPASVAALAKRLNAQRNVQVDFALIEEGDHMYNNHLVDLYKIAGNYIIGAMQKKAPMKKRRGRRKKVEMEQDNLLIGHNDDIDMDDEETGYEGDAEDFEEEEE